ncbi:MAG TPA: papain-like cysteine protease family protein [Leptospiraceae bacterium]|nr:papain-like cysteine protease family protein [Leptospiraceae bacterium]HMW07685.1 papain-like cysteine protease family protein [Leptospiraceae bacterium]HMX33819.1 papain-like cysteine protease family protein [Leptospiraceae bacterium]HMY33301.1 papain-like cysteine protease family protein [Leptospiraceae bacterium]HMZ63038.1 papain-like cysteine protease family protein [Leptospiraceae bacterium]
MLRIILSFTLILPLLAFEKQEGDFILENLNPPKEYWEIPEGSCGEACIYSIAKSLKMKITQEEINSLAGSPGRGIHSNEVLKVLKKLKIPFQNISTTVNNHRKYLEEKVIQNVKKGNPILLGVKIYPDENPKWVCDHFILIVGYNEKTGELIFNSNEERGRIQINKLLNKKDGFSILHKSKYVYAVQIVLAKNES